MSQSEPSDKDFWNSLLTLNATEESLLSRQPPQPLPPTNIAMSLHETPGIQLQPNIPLKETTALSPGQKRKLSLSLPPPNPLESELGEATRSSVCKSPRIVPDLIKSTTAIIPTCTICTDDLFSYEEGNDSPVENSKGNGEAEKSLRPVLSTKCGHLFHTGCINKWFKEHQDREIKTCPYCAREMMANDTTRCFPIF